MAGSVLLLRWWRCSMWRSKQTPTSSPAQLSQQVILVTLLLALCGSTIGAPLESTPMTGLDLSAGISSITITFDDPPTITDAQPTASTMVQVRAACGNAAVAPDKRPYQHAMLVSNAPVLLTDLVNGEECAVSIAAAQTEEVDGEVVITLGPATALHNVTVGAPRRPTAVQALPLDGSLQVTWTAGADNAAPVTGYIATASPFALTPDAHASKLLSEVPTEVTTVSAAIRTHTWTTLHGDVTYTVWVQASNLYGDSTPGVSPYPMSPTGGPLTILNGQTMTLNDPRIEFSSISIHAGGTLELTGVAVDDASGENPQVLIAGNMHVAGTIKGNRVHIIASVMTVTGTGVVHVDGASMATLGSPEGAFCGGSYGGLGLCGRVFWGLPGASRQWTKTDVAERYGDYVSPTLPGSRSGTDDSRHVGLGGGSLQLQVSTTLTIEEGGRVSADATTPAMGSAGSGGSVWIRTAELEGVGTIRANSVAGSTDHASHMPGGGGRVSVHITNASSLFEGTIEALGGVHATESSKVGFEGSVYLQGPTIEIHASAVVKGTVYVQAVTFKGSGLVTSSDANVRFLQPTNVDAFTGTVQAPTGSVYLNAGTTPTIPSGAVWKDVVFVNTMATLTVHGAIALSKVVEVELNATTSFTIPLGGSITGLGSTLVVRASSANVAGSVVALMLKWYGEALSIAATGSVSGDSMSVTTDMPGTPTGLFCGGWHAGTAPCPTVPWRGGWSLSEPGTTYGDPAWPTLPGSRSGGHKAAPEIYGYGGGAVHIIVTNLAVDGALSSDSLMATGTGGSGGSVLVQAQQLSGSGRITADGGSPDTTIDPDNGNGGGGRVALYIQGDMSGFTGDVHTRGGSGGRQGPGAPGTVYLDAESGTLATGVDFERLQFTPRRVTSLSIQSGVTVACNPDIDIRVNADNIDIAAGAIMTATRLLVESSTATVGGTIQASSLEWNCTTELQLQTGALVEVVDAARLSVGDITLHDTSQLQTPIVDIDGTGSAVIGGVVEGCDVSVVAAAGVTMASTGRLVADGCSEATTGTSSDSDCGASHAAYGRCSSQAGVTYGNMARPASPGSRSGDSLGGGIVRIITAAQLTLLAGSTISASALSGSGAGGSGGSVWATAGLGLHGAGTIAADGAAPGGAAGALAGSGGRIAVAIADVTAWERLLSTAANPSWAGSLHAYGPGSAGAGTVWLGGPTGAILAVHNDVAAASFTPLQLMAAEGSGLPLVEFSIERALADFNTNGGASEVAVAYAIRGVEGQVTQSNLGDLVIISDPCPVVADTIAAPAGTSSPRLTMSPLSKVIVWSFLDSSPHQATSEGGGYVHGRVYGVAAGSNQMVCRFGDVLDVVATVTAVGTTISGTAPADCSGELEFACAIPPNSDTAKSLVQLTVSTDGGTLFHTPLLPYRFRFVSAARCSLLDGSTTLPVGCSESMLADGTCDAACNVRACAWDNHDCEFATRDVFVAPQGDDANEGSQATPVASLQRAVHIACFGFHECAPITMLPGDYDCTALALTQPLSHVNVTIQGDGATDGSAAVHWRCDSTSPWQVTSSAITLRHVVVHAPMALAFNASSVLLHQCAVSTPEIHSWDSRVTLSNTTLAYPGTLHAQGGRTESGQAYCTWLANYNLYAPACDLVDSQLHVVLDRVRLASTTLSATVQHAEPVDVLGLVSPYIQWYTAHTSSGGTQVGGSGASQSASLHPSSGFGVHMSRGQLHLQPGWHFVAPADTAQQPVGTWVPYITVQGDEGGVSGGTSTPPGSVVAEQVRLFDDCSAVDCELSTLGEVRAARTVAYVSAVVQASQAVVAGCAKAAAAAACKLGGAGAEVVAGPTGQVSVVVRDVDMLPLHAGLMARTSSLHTDLDTAFRTEPKVRVLNGPQSALRVVTFERCSLRDDAPGIVASANLLLVHLRSVTIVGATSNQGAALYVANGAAAELEGCRVDSNRAISTGGAIHVTGTGSSVTATSTMFLSNAAISAGGGAIRGEYGAAVTASNCTFQSNSGSGGGGAISMFGAGSELQLRHSTLTNNGDNVGGAVSLTESATGVLHNLTLSGNEAYRGAHLHAHSKASYTISDCRFSEAASSYGTGLFLHTDCAATVSDSSFDGLGDTASMGGAVFAAASTVDLTRVTMQRCTGQNGAAIIATASSLVTLLDTQVSDCTSAAGAAVAVQDSTADLRGSSAIANNRHQGDATSLADETQATLQHAAGLSVTSHGRVTAEAGVQVASNWPYNIECHRGIITGLLPPGALDCEQHSAAATPVAPLLAIPASLAPHARNLPTRGGGEGGVRVLLSNAGDLTADSRVHAYMGGQVSPAVSLNHTSGVVTIEPPPGLGADVLVVVFVEGRSAPLFSSDSPPLVDYAPPTLQSVAPLALAPSGGVITITGMNFGPPEVPWGGGVAAAALGEGQDSSDSISVNDVQCSAASRVSHEELRCTVPSMRGSNLPIQVTIGAQAAVGESLTLTLADTPAAPFITSAAAVSEGESSAPSTLFVAWIPGESGGAPVVGFSLEVLMLEQVQTETESTERRLEEHGSHGEGEYRLVEQGTLDAAARSATVAGLAPGRVYQVRLAAVNTIGRGEAVELADPGIVLALSPTTPSIQLSEPISDGGNAAITSIGLVLHVPSDRGAPPQHMIVQYADNGEMAGATEVSLPINVDRTPQHMIACSSLPGPSANTTASSCELYLRQLTPYKRYWIRVAASNAATSSELPPNFSDRHESWAAVTAPSAPRAPLVTQFHGVDTRMVTVRFTAPAIDGGFALSNYRVDAAVASWEGSSSGESEPADVVFTSMEAEDVGNGVKAVTVGPLTLGVGYTMRVAAANELRPSSYGASSPPSDIVLVAGVPLQDPVHLAAVSASSSKGVVMDVSWLAAKARGSAVSHYTVLARHGTGGSGTQREWGIAVNASVSASLISNAVTIDAWETSEYNRDVEVIVTAHSALGPSLRPSPYHAQLSCWPGFGTPDGDSGKCSLCPVGSFSKGSFVGGKDAEAAACTPCAAGYIAATAGRAECEQCGAGTAAVERKQCDACPAGTYAQPGGVGCAPCPAGTFSSSPQATACSACPTGLVSEQEGATLCVTCPVGQVAEDGASSCKQCGEGTYVNGNSCAACPDQGAVCSGGVLAVLPGFWNPSLAALTSTNDGGGASSSALAGAGNASLPASLTFFRCPPNACVRDENGTIGCASGRGGVLCGRCLDNYIPSGMQCVQCTNRGTSWILLAATGFVLLGGTAAMVVRRGRQMEAAAEQAKAHRARVVKLLSQSSDTSSRTLRHSIALPHGKTPGRISTTTVRPGGGGGGGGGGTSAGAGAGAGASAGGGDAEESAAGPSMFVSTGKILITWLQVSSFMTDFPVDWPPQVAALWSGAGVSSSLPVNSGFVGCALGWSSLDRFKAAAALPVLVPIVLFPFYAARVRCRVPHGRARKRSISLYLQGCVMIWYLMYPTVIREMVNILNCSEEVDGKRFLRTDFAVTCFTPQHGAHVLVAIIVLGVYGVGLSLGAFGCLWRQRAKLRHKARIRMEAATSLARSTGGAIDTEVRDLAIAADEAYAKSASSLSFLSEEYQDRFYYWESIVMLKKCLLVIIATVIENPVHQLTAGLALVLVFLYLQTLALPHSLRLQRNLETAALTVNAVSLYTGVLLALADVGKVLVVVLTIVLVGINAALAVTFVVVLLGGAFCKAYNVLTRRRGAAKTISRTALVKPPAAVSAQTYSHRQKALARMQAQHTGRQRPRRGRRQQQQPAHPQPEVLAPTGHAKVAMEPIGDTSGEIDELDGHPAVAGLQELHGESATQRERAERRSMTELQGAELEWRSNPLPTGDMNWQTNPMRRVSLDAGGAV